MYSGIDHPFIIRGVTIVSILKCQKYNSFEPVCRYGVLLPYFLTHFVQFFYNILTFFLQLLRYYLSQPPALPVWNLISASCVSFSSISLSNSSLTFSSEYELTPSSAVEWFIIDVFYIRYSKFFFPDFLKFVSNSFLLLVQHDIRDLVLSLPYSSFLNVSRTVLLCRMPVISWIHGLRSFLLIWFPTLDSSFFNTFFWVASLDHSCEQLPLRTIDLFSVASTFGSTSNVYRF